MVLIILISNMLRIDPLISHPLNFLHLHLSISLPPYLIGN